MVQKWFCIQHSQMDLSFQERKQFVIPLHGLQFTTNLVIQENSGVFFKRPVPKEKMQENPGCTNLFHKIRTVFK